MRKIRMTVVCALGVFIGWACGDAVPEMLDNDASADGGTIDPTKFEVQCDVVQSKTITFEEGSVQTRERYAAEIDLDPMTASNARILAVMCDPDITPQPNPLDPWETCQPGDVCEGDYTPRNPPLLNCLDAVVTRDESKARVICGTRTIGGNVNSDRYQRVVFWVY